MGDGDEDNVSFSITGDKLLTNEVFVFDMKSSYSIRIQTEDTDGNTFSKSFLINIDKVLGIDQLNNLIKIYPNPIENQPLNIEVTSYDKLELLLMDVKGNIILTKKLNKGLNQIDYKEFSNGVYILRLLDVNEIVHQQRVIKK